MINLQFILLLLYFGNVWQGKKENRSWHWSLAGWVWKSTPCSCNCDCPEVVDLSEKLKIFFGAFLFFFLWLAVAVGGGAAGGGGGSSVRVKVSKQFFLLDLILKAMSQPAGSMMQNACGDCNLRVSICFVKC